MAQFVHARLRPRDLADGGAPPRRALPVSSPRRAPPGDVIAGARADRSTDPDPARLDATLDAETDEFAEPHPGVVEQQDRVALISRRGWLAQSNP